MAHEVFISYSRKDMAVADRICEAFDKAGISYFIDRQGIGGGFEFPEVLANAIIECKVVLYLASHNSYASKFTNAELTFAFNEKSKNSVLPYIIDGSTMPAALRFVFAGVNWRNIKDHPIETTLVADILKLLGREPKSEPKVEPKPIVPPQPKPKIEPKPEPSRPPRKPLNKDVLMALLCGVAAVVVLCVAIMGISTYNKGLSRPTKDTLAVAKRVELYPMTEKKVERSKKESEKVTKTYKVGDYYDDGTKQGVVFEVTADGRHGKIVSLKESSRGLQWVLDKSEQKRLIGADDKHNGANNMTKVKQIKGWRYKYPAFAWCVNLGEGWYLPAIEELKKFTLDSAIHDAVNRTLASKGTKLANEGDYRWYWSSTESTNVLCAWGVSMHGGNTYGYGKNSDGYVRAVSAF